MKEKKQPNNQTTEKNMKKRSPLKILGDLVSNERGVLCLNHEDASKFWRRAQEANQGTRHSEGSV